MVGRLKFAAVVLAVIVSLVGCQKQSAGDVDAAKAADATHFANAEIERIRAEAKRRYPHLSEDEAIKIVADEAGERRLSEGSEAERKVTAASAFMAVYVKHTEAYVSVCRDFGVDVSDFGSAVSRRFAGERARAMSILADAGANETVLRTLWDNMMPTIVSTTQRELTQMAPGGPEEACEVLRDEPQEVAESIELHETLTEVLQAP